MNKKLRCVFYARTGSVLSPCDSQIKMCKKFLSKHNEYELVDSYIDCGCSGKDENRKGYLNMLSRLNQGDIDVLLVQDFHRLSRSITLNTKIYRHLNGNNVKVLVLDGERTLDLPNLEKFNMLLLPFDLESEEHSYGR